MAMDEEDFEHIELLDAAAATAQQIAERTHLYRMDNRERLEEFNDLLNEALQILVEHSTDERHDARPSRLGPRSQALQTSSPTTPQVLYRPRGERAAGFALAQSALVVPAAHDRLFPLVHAPLGQFRVRHVWRHDARYPSR